MIRENEMTKRNLMVTLKSMTIEGDTIFVNKDGKYAGSILHDKWNIPFDYDEPVPLSFIDNIGMEFVKLYKRIYGKDCNATFTAEQHLMKMDGNLIEVLIDDFEAVVKTNDEEKEVRSIEDVRITRPNYGIGKQMRSFWKHQRYGQELELDDVYELFLTSFPKLKREVFITHLKAPSRLGGIHLVIEKGKIRKVDNSPMLC